MKLCLGTACFPSFMDKRASRAPSLLACSQVLQSMGLDGVLVLEVPHGSPAALAGLRPTHRDIFGDIVLGDVLVGMEGRPVRAHGGIAWWCMLWECCPGVGSWIRACCQGGQASACARTKFSSTASNTVVTCSQGFHPSSTKPKPYSPKPSDPPNPYPEPGPRRRRALCGSG